MCPKPVHPKGNQPWIFIGRTDAEAETPILWPPNVKNWLIWKDPDAGKDWRQEEKGAAEDETVGWHHQLDGHELEQTLGVDDGWEGLVCCSPWGLKAWDSTERLDNNNNRFLDSEYIHPLPPLFLNIFSAQSGEGETRVEMWPRIWGH